MTSWRDILQIHPAADLFPMMGPDELKALGEDIDKNGLKSPIVIWCRGECPLGRRGRLEPHKVNVEDVFLLDGRNRLDAMEAVGLKIEVRGGSMGLDVTKTLTCVADEDVIDFDGTISTKKGEEYEYEDDFGVETTILFEKEDGKVVCDPYAYVDSLNMKRRHLTAAQKGELIEALLKANPERSDRATAKIAQVDHKTVAAKRDKLEQGGEIPHQETRVGKDGVAQPAEKPKFVPTPTEPARPPAPQPVTPADHSEPEQEVRDPGQPPNETTATAADTGASEPPPAAPPIKTEPPQPVAPAEPEIAGERVDAELMKWVAAYRSWPWPRQEVALSLIGVDEDSLADLKEDHDLLELKDTLLDAQREKISRLEQENRSLQECPPALAEPIPAAPPEMKPVDLPEEVRRLVRLLSTEELEQFAKWFIGTEPSVPKPEPAWAEPVLADVVEVIEHVAPEVTEPEPDPKPEPIKPHPLVTKFFDCFANNLVPSCISQRT